MIHLQSNFNGSNTFGTREICSETGSSSKWVLIVDQNRRQSRYIVSIFFNMKVFCVFSLESLHRGDSNENTKYTILNITLKITINYPKSAAMGFFPGNQERVRNSRGKRAISVRAIDVLLYIWLCEYERRYVMVNMWLNTNTYEGLFWNKTRIALKVHVMKTVRSTIPCSLPFL